MKETEITEVLWDDLGSNVILHKQFSSMLIYLALSCTTLCVCACVCVCAHACVYVHACYVNLVSFCAYVYVANYTRLSNNTI